MNRNEDEIKVLRGFMKVLVEDRDKLISNNMPMAEVTEVQRHAALSIDLFNHQQNLDLVARNKNGVALSPLR